MSIFSSFVCESTSKQDRITLIEDVPQAQFLPNTNRTKLTIPSFHGDSALQHALTGTPASDQTSDASSLWSNRSSQSSLDSLYDVTDNEVEEVPIKLSASIKRHTKPTGERSRFPSLIIPSPSKWPTIQKLPSPGTIGLSPASKIAVTPAALSAFNAVYRHTPPASSAPSLAGSMTSEEMSLQSCPSTPELHSPGDSSIGEWDQPIRLDPRAFEVLHQLQPEVALNTEASSDPIIAISDEAIQEMQEIIRNEPLRHDFSLSAIAPRTFEPEEAVSALSVPSPGGFFSSLAPCDAQTWSRHPPEPSTGVAEDFYGVPWRRRGTPEQSDQDHLHLVIPGSRDSGPIPALSLVLTPSDDPIVDDNFGTTTPVDHMACYEDALTLASMEHVDRTNHWLKAQASYMSRLRGDGAIEESKTDSSACSAFPPSDNTPADEISFPSKKAVRFSGLDGLLTEVLLAKDTSIVDCSDPVFYHAFQHMHRRNSNRDAFVHAQNRVEAEHVERSNLVTTHCKQLGGRYDMSTPTRPSPVRPISSMLPATSDDDVRKDIIATVERERKALEQVKTSAWCLEAERQIRGGRLLHSPAEKRIRGLPSAKILDYAGRPAGDWAWQIALEYPTSAIYTVSSSSGDQSSQNNIKGPSNHRIVTAARPWVIPFPNATFDIISARSLHLFLRGNIPNPSPQSPISPNSIGEDEWDLVLTELYRVLKPGGYLEFTIYDAPLLHPGPLGRAASVEFVFNLRARGFDPSPCRKFLPRLRKAGFNMIRRGWFVLPMADVQPRWTDTGKIDRLAESISSDTAETGQRTSTNFFEVEKKIGPNGKVEMYKPALTGSTDYVKAMTGLVGARAWEQWMLKTGREMGRSDVDIMGEVSRVLVEGGKQGSGWTCLLGWARK